MYVQGSVKITDSAGQERVAQKGAVLHEREVVTTGHESWTQLRMQDEALIALRPDTIFKIEAYQFNGQEDGTERGVLGLLKGGFRTLTGLIGRKNHDQYRIYTPTATIGIRGTDHEPVFIPADGGWSGAPEAPPGTYDKVNSGATFIETQAGRVNLGPNQAGFVPPRIDAVPAKLDRMPDFYRPQPMMGGGRPGNPPGDQPGDMRRGDGTRTKPGSEGTGGQPEGQKFGGSGPGGPGMTPLSPAEEPGGGTPMKNAVQPGSVTPMNPVSSPGSLLPATGPGPLSPQTPGSLIGPATITPINPTQPPSINLNLDESPTAAPTGFALAGGDKSGQLIGSGSGMVGNGDDLSVLVSPKGNPIVVGDSGGNFTYLRNQATMIENGNALIDGIPIRWGIYAGGSIVDQTTGQRNVDFFHFITAGQAMPQASIPGFSGRYSTVAAFTAPVTEFGWRTGSGSVSTDITINNGTLTSLTLNVADWMGRQWIATNATSETFAQFVKKGVQVNGTVDGTALTQNNSTVSGIPVTTSGTGLIGSYSLHGDNNKAVTGSFLAR